MKKLEELLNLPPFVEDADDDDEDSVELTNLSVDETREALRDADANIDKINAALPLVGGLDSGDRDLDKLSTLAEDTFRDLITLSENIDPKFSAPILQVASSILGHAISAKVAKLDKKLKMVDLQLKKARLDLTAASKAGAGEGGVNAEGELKKVGVKLDRNELLKMLQAAKK